MFGGGSDATTTTQVKYTPEQQALIKNAMPILTGQLNSPPTLPNFNVTQPFNANQQQAHQLAIQQALGPLSQFSTNTLNASNFLMGDALSPDTNPYLRQTAEAAVRPVTEALTTSWLPAIRSGAIENQALGGSRQHNLEARAVGRAAGAATDATGKIYSDAFQAGMGNLVKSIALAPQTSSVGTIPASVLEGVGGQQYGLSTAFAKEAYDKYMQSQMLPYMTAKDVLGTAMGLGTGTTTTQAGATGSQLAGALQGGVGGLAALAGAGFTSPWLLGGGSAAMALAGLFS